VHNLCYFTNPFTTPTYLTVNMNPDSLSRSKSLPMAVLACLLLISLVLTPQAAAQETVPAPEPRPSPLNLARTTLPNGTYVKVHYSSPRKRDRVIFGELVPFGELWRTAANENTEITFTGNVIVGGQAVAAGTYTVFTIPGQATWTVILSKGLGQSGTVGYDPAQDALRVEVPATQMGATYEPFTILFEEAEGGTDLVMRWDQTQVAVPIRLP